MTKLIEGVDYEISSGNVFKDLGVPDADELAARADLIIEIKRITAQHRITQVELAVMADLPESEITLLMSGQLRRFSIDIIKRVLAEAQLLARWRSVTTDA